MIWQKKPTAQTDRSLVVVIWVLVAFGLVMLASASSVVAYNQYQDGNYFIKHQLLNYLIGLVVFWLLSRLDYQYLKRIGLFLLISSVVLLLLVFVPGLAKGGRAMSWINIFGFSLQPSELVKFCFLVYISALFANAESAAAKTVPFLMSFAVIALLMLMQPDLGTLIIITITALSVYYIAGGSLKVIGGILLGGALCLSVLLAIKPYQQDRFHCFFNPAFSPGDKCYQLNQSLIAVGSGGLIGRGLGESRQKFLYLPEVQNDFIFGIIAEEVGFVFCLVMILLYGFIFLKGYKIAYRVGDDFGRNLSFGIVVWLMAQAIVNIGGVINFMPMTGVPLPLVSYGGSAVLANMAALGVLVNISKQISR